MVTRNWCKSALKSSNVQERDTILGDEYFEIGILCRILLLNYNEERQPSEVVVVGY